MARGPFDVELEKAEMCDKERQGLGAAKMEYSSVTLDKDVPKRYHISGRGYFNYNTSDDLSVRVEVVNFTVDHKQQSYIKEWVYGRWKVENQIIDTAYGNRVVSCHRAIFRVVPKKPEKPMPAVVPAFDNTDRLSVEMLEPPDAPP
ncbi:hypothetical protein FOCC_FOCC007229 [Frankliniella occidentalis]|nr:hypothetical protein FOCC_FOCC007229 [Frankliniella occidentalis]